MKCCLHSSEAAVRNLVHFGDYFRKIDKFSTESEIESHIVLTVEDT